MFFEDNIDDTKYCGHLYGLSVPQPTQFDCPIEQLTGTGNMSYNINCNAINVETTGDIAQTA